MLRTLGEVLVVGAAITAAGCGAAASPRAHGPSPAEYKAAARTQVASTPAYRLTLRIGPVEGMLMPYQVRANHVKHGEMMLGGRMVVPMNGPLHHLEVHIFRKHGGGVVTNANPTIVLRDETTQRPPQKIAVAVMEGIGAGVADLHYGNTVAMPHHHRYAIAVTVHGQRAVFRVMSP